jgi:hypothetical protein
MTPPFYMLKPLYIDALIPDILSYTLIHYLGLESVVLPSAIALYTCIDNSYCHHQFLLSLRGHRVHIVSSTVISSLDLLSVLPYHVAAKTKGIPLASSCPFVKFQHLDPHKNMGTVITLYSCYNYCCRHYVQFRMKQNITAELTGVEARPYRHD